MTSVSSLAILTGAMSSVLLALLIVVHRVVSGRRRDRNEQEAQRLRPLVFRLLGDPRVMEPLVGLDRRSWAAVEPTVISLLGNVSGAAREQLVELLVRRGTMDSARRGLRARRVRVRVDAVHLVGLLRSREDLPQVLPLLEDPCPDVRSATARTLGRLADVRAARPLLDGLSSSLPLPAHIVVHSLLAMGSAAHTVLVDALDHPQATVRAAAVEVLGLGAVVATFPAVVRVLRGDTALPVRLAAVRALARMGTPATAAVLIGCLDGRCPGELRAAAAEALGTHGDPAAADALGVLLAEESHRLAHNASRSLIRLGAPGRVVLTNAAAGRLGPAAAAHAVEALAWDHIARARVGAAARSRP